MKNKMMHNDYKNSHVCIFSNKNNNDALKVSTALLNYFINSKRDLINIGSINELNETEGLINVNDVVIVVGFDKSVETDKALSKMIDEDKPSIILLIKNQSDNENITRREMNKLLDLNRSYVQAENDVTGMTRVLATSDKSVVEVAKYIESNNNAISFCKLSPESGGVDLDLFNITRFLNGDFPSDGDLRKMYNGDRVIFY